MSDKTLNIDEPTPSRYEFRTFGHHFKEHQDLMVQLTQPVPEDLQLRILDEVYIVSKNIDEVNIKIKNNLLDIKKLLKVENKLEQWDTINKYKFPISKELLLGEILPLLNADLPLMNIAEFDINQLLTIAKRHKDLIPISVHKKRHTYIVNYTICEYAEVIIGNEYFFTIAVESTEPDEVIKTVEQLKLDLYENINYVQAIKRVSELSDKPFAN